MELNNSSTSTWDNTPDVYHDVLQNIRECERCHFDPMLRRLLSFAQDEQGHDSTEAVLKAMLPVCEKVRQVVTE